MMEQQTSQLESVNQPQDWLVTVGGCPPPGGQEECTLQPRRGAPGGIWNPGGATGSQRHGGVMLTAEGAVQD